MRKGAQTLESMLNAFVNARFFSSNAIFFACSTKVCCHFLGGGVYKSLFQYSLLLSKITDSYISDKFKMCTLQNLCIFVLEILCQRNNFPLEFRVNSALQTLKKSKILFLNIQTIISHLQTFKQLFLIKIDFFQEIKQHF